MLGKLSSFSQLLVGLSLAVIMASCSSTPDNTTVAPVEAPILELAAGSSAVITTEAPEVNAGKSFLFKFTLTKGNFILRSMQLKLSGSATIRSGYSWGAINPAGGFIKNIAANFTGTTITDSIWISIPSIVTSTPKIILYANDEYNLKDSILVTPTGVMAYNNRSLKTPLKVTSTQGAVVSFLSSIDGKTFTHLSANGNSGFNNAKTIDMGFYYGFNTKATLCSPTVFTENMIVNTDTIVSLEKWNIQNETRFKKTTSRFSDSLNLVQIKELFVNGTDASNSIQNPFSRVTDLNNDDAFVFQTSRGKIGFGRLYNISASTTTGSATIDYRVEY
jgi:hypothetical protein